MLSCRSIGQLYTITCLFSDILGVTTSFWFALFHFYAFCSPTQSRTFRPRRASQIRTAIKDRKLRLTGHSGKCSTSIYEITGHSGKCIHQYIKSQDTVVSVVHHYMKSQDTVVSVYINILNHRTQWAVYLILHEITFVIIYGSVHDNFACVALVNAGQVVDPLHPSIFPSISLSISPSATFLGWLVCVIGNFKSFHSFVLKLCILIDHTL